MLNTSGKVWAAGWENGWLLVYYELTAGENVGGVHVGYVDGSKISGSVEINTILSFDNTPCQVSTACSLTDDPLRKHAPIATLEEGVDVICLCTTASPDGTVWDYIETTYQDQIIRGFVPTSNLKTVDAVKETVPDESMLRWRVPDANISISLPEEYYVFMLDDSDPRLNFSSEEV